MTPDNLSRAENLVGAKGRKTNTWLTQTRASLVSKRYSVHTRPGTTECTQRTRIDRLPRICAIPPLTTNQSPNKKAFQVGRVLFRDCRALSPGFRDGKGTREPGKTTSKRGKAWLDPCWWPAGKEARRNGRGRPTHKEAVIWKSMSLKVGSHVIHL